MQAELIQILIIISAKLNSKGENVHRMTIKYP